MSCLRNLCTLVLLILSLACYAGAAIIAIGWNDGEWAWGLTIAAVTGTGWVVSRLC